MGAAGWPAIVRGGDQAANCRRVGGDPHDIAAPLLLDPVRGGEVHKGQHVGLDLAAADRHAERLAPSVGVDPDRDDHRDRDDVVPPPGFDVGGVEPNVGPFALARAGEEGCTRLSITPQRRDTGTPSASLPPVDRCAMALADPLHAHGFTAAATIRLQFCHVTAVNPGHTGARAGAGNIAAR